MCLATDLPTHTEVVVEHPIWRILEHQGRSLKWLAARTGYSEDLVIFVKTGRRNASVEFRAKCAAALDLPEWSLFADPTGANAEPMAVA